MSLISKIKNYAKPIAKSSLGLGAGLVSLLGTSTNAQTAPGVEWSDKSIDQNGVLSLTTTNLQPGTYYMAGFTEDLSVKFQPIMNDFFLATTNSETFYTDLPTYTQAGYFVMVPLNIPTTTFSQTDNQTFTGKFTTQINTTGNQNYHNNQLWLYDLNWDIPYFIKDTETNNLSLEINTQNYANSYYALESWQKVEGTSVIEGLESFWFNSGTLYFGNDNDFCANDPIQALSNFNGNPTFNFTGIPGKEYIAELYSIDSSGTNLIGDTTLSEAESLVNGGGFSMVWDRSNDPGAPNYLINVISPDDSPAPLAGISNFDSPIMQAARKPGSTYTNVYQMRVGDRYIRPHNLWMHAEEYMTSHPFVGAYLSAQQRHAENAAQLEWLYPFDWNNMYGINQKNHVLSPLTISSQEGVTNFLNQISVTNTTIDANWVSYLTLFGHMNNQAALGGTGSAIPEDGGFTYQMLAEKRGTIIGESGETTFIDSSKGALDGMIMEGCESSSGNRELFQAGGIARWDAYYNPPNFGIGQWANVPALRIWVLVKRNNRITADYIGESFPTIGDAISANKYFYPEGLPFIDNFGCMHKYYAKAMGITGDISNHSFPNQQFYYNPGFSNAPPASP